MLESSVTKNMELSGNNSDVVKYITKKFGYTPTLEQQKILNDFRKHKVIKINAVAGSGKSSTLKMLAESNVTPSLYICFNKQNAVLAQESFPKHTVCKTVHSLAYAKFGKLLAHKITYKDLTYINRGRTPKEISTLYSVGELRFKDCIISSIQISLLAKKAVEVYQNTALEDITRDCVDVFNLSRETVGLLTSDQINTLVETVLRVAKKLWCDKVNPSSVVKADHDTYQKLFQLSNPVLDYQIIYLDEAQDSSPVVLDIIAKQKDAKVVYVGDSYQSIYAFRQAVNAMEKITAPTYLLSKSFRYGESIAKIATEVIQGAIKVEGLESIPSVVRRVDMSNEKHTMIFRTNSALLERAVQLISMGVKVKCDIDPKKFMSLLYSTHFLKVGALDKVKDEEVMVYSTFNEMVEDSENSPEIKRLVTIILSGRMGVYIDALNKMVKTNKNGVKNYHVLLTTAHKSKGMEWDTVVIADDFPEDAIFDDIGCGKYNQQEVNLFYVACTRAIKVLDVVEYFNEEEKETIECQ